MHDVPLLAESRRHGGFDLVIVVDVPPEVQVERLVSQRGMTPDQARARMAAQASREQRLAVADIVMDNSGSLDRPGPPRRRGLGRPHRPDRRPLAAAATVAMVMMSAAMLAFSPAIWRA